MPFHDALALCTRLRSLNLSTCALAWWPLPQRHLALPELRELVLSRNSAMQEVPPFAFSACPGLVKLDVSG